FLQMEFAIILALDCACRTKSELISARNLTYYTGKEKQLTTCEQNHRARKFTNIKTVSALQT
ncbi:hypothetical protein KSI10_25260, partial [Salmonella enterica subsp. enterica serovar Indiana]|nr:hypothetical protein [Salmonella enterica subsp. enterica serovar Indiana]